MACITWHELLEAWVIASRRYAYAVMAARGSAGGDFETLRARAQDAKADCLQAEKALREHERTHGCLHGGMAARRSA